MMNIRFCTWALALLLIPSFASGQIKYAASVNKDALQLWSTSSSKVACVLSYSIPNYGRADFEVFSGKSRQINFELFPLSQIRENSTMRIVSAPNDWTPIGNEKIIGKIKVYEGFNPFIGNTVSRRMLTALDKGRQILLPYTRPKTIPNETIVPAISPLGFKDKYKEFATCLNNLLDISFDEVGLISLIFNANSEELTPRSILNLKRQVEYVINDPAVMTINIKTFAFGATNDKENEELAKKRAATIEKIFTDGGVNKSLIQSQYVYNNNLSPNTISTVNDLDSRKALIELKRDVNKIRYNNEVEMPDVGKDF